MWICDDENESKKVQVRNEVDSVSDENQSSNSTNLENEPSFKTPSNVGPRSRINAGRRLRSNSTLSISDEKDTTDTSSAYIKKKLDVTEINRPEEMPVVTRSRRVKKPQVIQSSSEGIFI